MNRDGARRDTVLFVSVWPYLGGSQASLLTALEALHGRIRAVLVAPGSGVLIDRIRQRGLVDEHIVIPNREHAGAVRTRFVTGYTLCRWLVRNRRRLLAVHANGDAELKLLLPVMWMVPRPVVVWHHSAPTRSTIALSPVWRRLTHRIVWASVSRVSSRELRSQRIANESNTVVVPNPIDPGEVVADQSHRHACPPFVLGYLGCEYEAKGFLLLPELARRIAHLPVVLSCVTKEWPPERNSAAVNDALAHLRELSPTVRLRARDHDVRNIYAEIDALLVPSLAESFCRIAAEAMLNDIPVIASDLPALRELCGDDEAGLLFPVGDVNGAAAAVARVVGEPDLRAQLVRNGRERATNFAPDHIASELLSLYRLSMPIDVREAQMTS